MYFLSNISGKLNQAIKNGLNEVKSIWSGSAAPVLSVILLIGLIIMIVMAVISNRQGESPVRFIVIGVIIVIVMAVVVASSGWL
ncbi:hypothetical protein LJB88_04805 [Erysipelotrichaceae bacterium OttesenSCG-928-M19]|nr:hypothetical protein [Erysipelotrichaceae bacterium OttesenSCG-928-M19]